MDLPWIKHRFSLFLYNIEGVQVELATLKPRITYARKQLRMCSLNHLKEHLKAIKRFSLDLFAAWENGFQISIQISCIIIKPNIAV